MNDILYDVLDQWKSAIDDHDPQRAAALFTNDAIFQGLHPYGVGRDAVAEYYESQPIGLSPQYKLLETRQLADDTLLGYLAVDFSFTDRPAISVNLLVILRQAADGWLISHYQVSRL
ncbi:SgcJ/EcaC family oxidoreductase [Kribbella sp. NPDC058693]|uniref:SgcJ/EcaC family oxidoreductase n=1 Tax=Kribbella sp. NPDC058693 TaxID=3346602 RepID=UPI00365384C6